MKRMMWRGYVENLPAFFLFISFSTRGSEDMHCRCELFIADNERNNLFIHHLLFRCKFTKFIFFLSTILWKSLFY